MTAPGDSTEVGSIVGYLILNRSDWTAGVRETERDADKLGRLSPNIRIQTNTGEILGQLALVHAAERKVGSEADKAKPFVMNLWAALAAVAPAAVPIAGVVGGALLGLLPTFAAVMFGIKGIQKEMKSGALAGTQYGRDIAQIKAEGQKLQQISAQGLLSGLGQADQAAHPLFKMLNQDIGTTAGQIGSIVGHGIPALLSLLHQLSPLFTTIGNELTRGAVGFQHWAQNSQGISHFVAYVQAELPHVEQFIGNVITLVAHLIEASAPFGGVVLNDFTLFVHVLNMIPVGVLKDAIPVATSLYLALKAFQGVNAILAGLGVEVGSLGDIIGLTGPKATLAAAQQKAASLSIEAAAAGEAATVARAKAVEAIAYAEASAQIAASAQAQASILAEGAAATAAAAAQEAAAFMATADAATASAAQVAASAQAAATAADEAGAAASVGWASMLGPIGAAVAGVGLFTTFLLGNSDASQQAAAAQDSYAESVKHSTDALAAANRQQTLDNLAKSGALVQLEQYHKQNILTSISTNDLVDAVNGSASAYHKVESAISGSESVLVRTGNLFGGLGDKVTLYRNGLLGSIAQQRALDSAQHANISTVQQLSSAIADYDKKLQALGQTEIAQAQSQDQLDSALLQVNAQVKANGDEINKNTKGGLANRDMILSLLSGALSLAAAQRKNHEGITKVTSDLEKNVKQIEATAHAAGLSKPQIDRLVAAMHLTPKDIRTLFHVDTAAARAALAALLAQAHSVASAVALNNAGGYLSGRGYSGPTRAGGGPVYAGTTYLVGEQGPELFTAPANGKVLPHGQTALALHHGSLPSPAPLRMTALRHGGGGAGSSGSGGLAAAQAGVTPDSIRAAIHGARLVIDPSLMTATIDTRASAATRDYQSFLDDIGG